MDLSLRLALPLPSSDSATSNANDSPKPTPTRSAVPVLLNASAAESTTENTKSNPTPKLGLSLGLALPAHSTSDTADATDAPSSPFLTESAQQIVQLDSCKGVISQIRPFLFVSGAEAASSPEKLAEYHINHVVNCVSDRFPSPQVEGVERTPWHMRDSKQQSLIPYIFPFVTLVEKCRLAVPPKRLLVHCHVGSSRSCSLVIAYLLWRERGVAFRQVFDHVKQLRPISNPNIGFMTQLIQFAEYCKALPLPLPLPGPDSLLIQQQLGGGDNGNQKNIETNSKISKL